MALKFVDQADLTDKKVLARFDFNVPLDKEDPSVILDTTRVDRSLETIQYILDNGASKLILMSHLGRPKGEANPKYSLEPVAKYLADKLGEEVTLTESCLDNGIKTLLGLSTNRVILLQNLRYHKEETSNDKDFCRALASYGDVYINDAFGAAHRKHASTYGINEYFPNKAFGGLLLKKEIEALNQVVESPKAPFMAIVGGAKVSDKIKIIESLLVNVDNLLIGGAMAYPFLKAKGHQVGKSLCSEDDVKLAKRILNTKLASKIVLPKDHVGSTDFDGDSLRIDSVDIPDDQLGLDIGPQTIQLYKDLLGRAKTVLWNGPMGLFEREEYAKGTFEIANILSSLEDSFTLVGGGDSVSAVKKSGASEKMGHVSTGGGASLEYIENGTLPGIQALKFGLN